MTQIITALTPDGIVMGADSSVLLPPWGTGGKSFLYTGSRKLFQWEAHGILVGLFGMYPMEIGKQSFNEWMRDWHKIRSSEKISFDEVMDNLVNDLQATVAPLLPKGAKTGLHVAMWLESEDYEGTKIPTIQKVSNESGTFERSPMMNQEQIKAIYAHRIGKDTSSFPTAFFSDGIIDLGPEQHYTFRLALEGLIKAQVPSGHLDGVVNYVRLLLNLIGELHRVTDSPLYVASPIETAVSLPSPVSGFSMRL